MSLRECISLLLRKWKTVLIVTVAVMLLAAGYSVFKSYSALNSSNSEDKIYNIETAVMIANYKSYEENGKIIVDNNAFEIPDSAKAAAYQETFQNYMHTKKILNQVAASISNEEELSAQDLADKIGSAFTITSSGGILYNIKVVYTGKENIVELVKILINTLTNEAKNTFGFDYAQAIDSPDSLLNIASESGTGIGNILKSAALYGVIGVILGLILAVFIVLILDYFNMSIRTEEQMQNECKLPALGGDYLRVAVTLAAVCDSSSVRDLVIVNADKLSNSEDLCKYLNEQLGDKGYKITSIPGLFVEASSIKTASQADGVIIAAKQFGTTTKDVLKTLDILNLTSTNVIGGVLILDK